MDRCLTWLHKFIQKIDLNARMLRIFMDSVDKSSFYIGMCFHVIFSYDEIKCETKNGCLTWRVITEEISKKAANTCNVAVSLLVTLTVG